MRTKKMNTLYNGVFILKDATETIFDPAIIDLGVCGELRYIEDKKVYYCVKDIFNIWQRIEGSQAQEHYHPFARKFSISIQGNKGRYNREVVFMSEVDIYLLYQKIENSPFKRLLDNIIDQLILPYHTLDRETWEAAMECDYHNLYVNSYRTIYLDADYKIWQTEYLRKYLDFLTATCKKSERFILMAIYSELKSYGYDLDKLITAYQEQRLAEYLDSGYTLCDFEVEKKAFSTLYFIYQRRDLREQFEFCIKKQAMENGYIEEGGQSDELVT